MMHRPKWMAPAAFVQFLNRWSDETGLVKCVGNECEICDDRRVTVDHIVPRSGNGTDDLSNLQPLCDFCNSRKGHRPDKYWNRLFYFDKPLITSGLRVSQLDYIYNRILEFDDFFSRPYSAVNGKLFCFLQVVGAGKTLGMFALAFALNRCILEHAGAAPRIDRIKTLGNGRIGIDMVTAERDAYGVKSVSRRRSITGKSHKTGSRALKVAVAIRALSQSSTERQSLIIELSSITWLVSALATAKRKSRLEK